MELRGKRVVITGASRGIGEELAKAFAGRGAHVALVARSEGPLKTLADELGGTAHPCDLTDPAQVESVLDRIEGDGGPIDVLVNNAGFGPPGALWHNSAADVEQTVRLNLTAPLELCRQAIPRMLERGGGHLVNVSSLAAIGSVPGMTAYAGTKAGLAHASSALRQELRGLPIGVTTVLVGGVLTELLAEGEAYEPFHLGFERLRRIRLVPDTRADKLAEAVAAGVERDKKTVFLPKRAAFFVLCVETPRRIINIVLAGVPRRA